MVAPFRLLVFGGRDYRDWEAVCSALDRAHAKRPVTCLIHGCCHTTVNADKLAGKWAKLRGIYVEEYPVREAVDGPWPGAGPRRNARMMLYGCPDAGLGFPGGNGTDDMYNRLKRAELPVWLPYGLHAPGVSLPRVSRVIPGETGMDGSSSTGSDGVPSAT